MRGDDDKPRAQQCANNAPILPPAAALAAAESGGGTPCPTGEVAFIEKGTPVFRRTMLSMFCAGFATFALLYSVQPLLPILSREFGMDAARASLVLSVATAMLAAGLVATGPLSDAIGRKKLRFSSQARFQTLRPVPDLVIRADRSGE